MQVIRWFVLFGLIAYGADTALYHGAHADSVIYLARHVSAGILLGLLQTL
jgi:hypothetical protein